jgi:hypothetical protein
MRFLSIVVLGFLFYACSTTEKILYPGGKDAAKKSAGTDSEFINATCDSTHDRKLILNYIDNEMFIPLQEAMKKCDLKGQSELHNFLARSTGRSESIIEMTKFLVSRGAKLKEVEPEESEDDKSFIMSMNGPLQTALTYGKFNLANYYLSQMSLEDIVKGSFGFRGITLKYLQFIEKKYPDIENVGRLELDYINRYSYIKNTVERAIQVNKTLCTKGDSRNCKAQEHLTLQLQTLSDGVSEITYEKGCVAQMAMYDSNELMQKQMELGQKTQVAEAKAYDEHAQKALSNRRFLNDYKNIYFSVTGKKLDLSSCN